MNCRNRFSIRCVKTFGSFSFSHAVVANAKMKKELQEIENRILFLLSNSTGNILDDHELIETLASSKKTSTEITNKARKTRRKITAFWGPGVSCLQGTRGTRLRNAVTENHEAKGI